MRIGELAKRTGLTASRIRFYEASGLIRSVERQSNGYRTYGPDAQAILEIVTSAQSAGFSLEEIRSLLPEFDGQWQHHDLLEGLKRKVAEIEAMQLRLEQSKARLLTAIECIGNGPEELSCEDRALWLLNRVREEGA